MFTDIIAARIEQRGECFDKGNDKYL